MPKNTINPTKQSKIAALINRIPVGISLFVLAAICGVGAGVAAWFLKYIIGLLTKMMFSAASSTGSVWALGFMPIIGVTLAVAYQKFIAKRNLEHETEQIISNMHKKKYGYKPSMCLHPIFASTVTLGFGGSAGAEGPVAFSGAAIGSNIARLAGVNEDLQRVMVGCGAGAGIAGIFKAPIAGVLFSLEVLKVRVNTLSVLALVVACICSCLTCYVLTDYSFDVRFLPDSFFVPSMLGWIAALGVFCGLYSVYYNRVAAMLTRFFNRISNIWLRGLTGGAIVGVCIMLFPVFYGEGYPTITELINGITENFAKGGIMVDLHESADSLILMGFAIILLKVFAVISSNSSGGVAGDFTPTVFAGAFVGMAFAATVNHFFDAHLPIGLFSLLGASGAFSGIIHAPLMAIFLVCEIVGNGFGFFLPLSVVALISYTIVKFLTPRSRYINGNHDDLHALLSTPAAATTTTPASSTPTSPHKK